MLMIWRNFKILVSVFTIVVSSICAVGKAGPGNALTERENVKINGMSIESIHVRDKTSVLTTTGGVFHVDLENGTIEIKQRIGKERILAKVMLDKDWLKTLSSPVVDGFDCIWEGLSTKGSRMVIAGDSTIRFYNIEKLQVKLQFSPMYHKLSSSCGGLLTLDNDGGLVIAPPKLSSRRNWPKRFKKNSWELSAKEPLSLLFIGLCPPRHFDWDASFRKNVHYSSHTQRYPTDEQIIEYSKYATVLEMHSWIWQNRYDENTRDTEGNKYSLWYDFSFMAQNYKWIPDNEAELKRVVKTAHACKMKVVPYVNSLSEEFKYTATADVLEIRMAELKRLKETYDFDGFYLDGLYPLDPELSYTVARALRQLVGENGWLTLHDTRPRGYYFPFVNTYMDFIITSEHSSFDRWNSTSYNISNAVASVWPEISMDVEDGREFLKELIDNSLKHNNRVVLMDGKDGQWRMWRLYFTKEEMKFVQEYYFRALGKMKSIYLSERADALEEKITELTPRR